MLPVTVNQREAEQYSAVDLTPAKFPAVVRERSRTGGGTVRAVQETQRETRTSPVFRHVPNRLF